MAAAGKDNICLFCNLSDLSSEDLGPVCRKGTVVAHQNCLYFSSGLCQNGDTSDDLIGFLEEDIKAEITRGRSHPRKCPGCKQKGLFVGCAVSSCKRAGHLPCIIKQNFLLQYFDNFRVYCPKHRPTQNYTSTITSNKCPICLVDTPTKTTPSTIPFELLLTPCCQHLCHRPCIQLQARSAGIHYFRCPVCNNQDKFIEEMLVMGIEIPTRDASWELCDQFNDIHNPRVNCSLPICTSNSGRRSHTQNNKVVDCSWCGQCIGHIRCIKRYEDNPTVVMVTAKHDSKGSDQEYICSDCAPVYRRKRKLKEDNEEEQTNDSSPSVKISRLEGCELAQCVCIYGRTHTSPRGPYRLMSCIKCGESIGHFECLGITQKHTSSPDHRVESRGSSARKPDKETENKSNGETSRQYVCTMCHQSSQGPSKKKSTGPENKATPNTIVINSSSDEDDVISISSTSEDESTLLVCVENGCGQTTWRTVRSKDRQGQLKGILPN